MRDYYFNPFAEGWELFSRFMCCGMPGRRYYTRRERIEHLEKMKERLQKELAGIEEAIEDLKKSESK